MDDDTQYEPEASSADDLAEQSRHDLRIGRADQAYTPDQARVLLQELAAYKVNSSVDSRRPLSWRAVAHLVGVPESTLGELRGGRCKGDADKHLKAIDEFLARERERGGRANLRDFAPTRGYRQMYAVFRAAVRHNSIGVVIAPPGSGKSVAIRAIAIEHEGVVSIRIDQANANARGVTWLLAQALELSSQGTHRERLAAILEYLQKNHNVVLEVDEAQKLKPDGLEVLRDIHDASDPEGRRNLPMVLFGDLDLYKLIVRARGGERTSIKPQMSRRIYPIINLAGEEGSMGDGGGLFSVEDVVRVLRNDRLHLVDGEGVRWLMTLANLDGWGSLGFAMVVCRMAFDVSSKTPLTAYDLRRALQLCIGPAAVVDIDSQAGGRLLAKAV